MRAEDDDAQFAVVGGRGRGRGLGQRDLRTLLVHDGPEDDAKAASDDQGDWWRFILGLRHCALKDEKLHAG